MNLAYISIETSLVYGYNGRSGSCQKYETRMSSRAARESSLGLGHGIGTHVLTPELVKVRIGKRNKGLELNDSEHRDRSVAVRATF